MEKFVSKKKIIFYIISIAVLGGVVLPILTFDDTVAMYASAITFVAFVVFGIYSVHKTNKDKYNEAPGE